MLPSDKVRVGVEVYGELCYLLLVPLLYFGNMDKF